MGKIYPTIHRFCVEFQLTMAGPFSKCGISEEDILTFQNDGVICLRAAVDQKWINILKNGIEENRRNPSEMTKRKGHTSFFHDYNNWRCIKEYEEFIFQSGVGEIAAKFLQSSAVALYSNHVIVKDSGCTKQTPWHQDQSYYEIDGQQVCSIWLPVDPVSKYTCLRLVQGSHRWTKVFKPVRFDGPPYISYEVKLGHEEEEKRFLPTPDVDGNEDYQVLSWDMEPGDCILFHMRTVHGSKGNNLPTPRRAFSTRWLGKDAVKGERPWMNLPPSQISRLKKGDGHLGHFYNLQKEKRECFRWGLSFN
ncbi:probable phytanoyl-CoA dioxygenase [Montipora capricornis]|uniref:probable phytanoyl-CoA dioxygenase n=1 Tax=Montipora capricornis TaxID=246305 RepID=UPI0035F1DBC3